jgi:hypothetical protein
MSWSFWAGPTGIRCRPSSSRYRGRRPILAIRRDEEDIGAKLVEARDRGLAAWNRPEAIAAAVGELYGHWKRNTLESRFDLRELQEYSAVLQADRLRDLIERVVAGGRPR